MSQVVIIENVTQLTFIKSPTPTSAATAGAQGQVISDGSFLYFCSKTGSAGNATWNKITMSQV